MFGASHYPADNTPRVYVTHSIMEDPPHAGLLGQFRLISADVLLPLASFMPAGSPKFHSSLPHLALHLAIMPYFALSHIPLLPLLSYTILLVSVDVS